MYASDRNAEDRLADDVRSSAPSVLVNEPENDDVVRSPAPSRDVRSGAATEPSRELLFGVPCIPSHGSQGVHQWVFGEKTRVWDEL